MSLPIVRLEVEGFKQSMIAAFSKLQMDQCSAVQEALDKVLTPENIQAVLDRTIAEELVRAIEEETKAFFSYGEGRKIVREAVIAKLSKES